MPSAGFMPVYTRLGTREMVSIHKNKELWILFIIIALIITGSFMLYIFSFQDDLLILSTKSAQPLGVKGLYLLLEELDFNVSSVSGDISHYKGVVILFEPQMGMAHDEKIMPFKEWVSRGNTLIIVGNYNRFFKFLDDPDDMQEKSIPETFKWPEDHEGIFYDIPYGRGNFRLIPDLNFFTNAGMRKKGNATRIINCLWEYHDVPIYFYSFLDEGRLKLSGVWSNSPISLLNWTERFILIQILLGIILYVFFVGKRLGLPVVYEEEALRKENEDVLALAALMERADLRQDALMLYYRQFEKEASGYFKRDISGNAELLEELWMQYELGNLDELREVHEYTESIKKGEALSKENMIDAFRKIDKLRETFVNNGKGYC
ncbi:MAG: DUF4350 domain-containing protein [Clostridiaceae bacterium]|nr:DUF4350 domain-containing protein [Clostridiaceae bacterium]